MKLHIVLAAASAALVALSSQVNAAGVCKNYGPQTPRDIASKSGANPFKFSLARPAAELNLCNIHFHTNAEHKGPGFSISAGAGKHGGYKCNETGSLTKTELSTPTGAPAACKGVKPGDTVEFHWVHTSCDITPGKGLESCSSAQCANPELRVETQVFLVVNDPAAGNFADFAFGGNKVNGLHQAKAFPTKTGEPIVFQGSTTGTKYSAEKCSPLQVTWSVRPACAKIDISSLNKWCAANVFEENHAHGVRQLVTAPELLAPIK